MPQLQDRVAALTRDYRHRPRDRRSSESPKGKGRRHGHRSGLRAARVSPLETLPLLEGSGIGPVLRLRSPEDSGEDVVFILCRIPGFEAFSRLRNRFHFESAPQSEEWLRTARSLRIGGWRRLLFEPASDIELLRTEGRQTPLGDPVPEEAAS